MLSFAFLAVPLIAGLLFGYFLRQRRQIRFGKATFAVILVLIFSLGFSIGSNDELLGALPQVGESAIVIASLAILFSVILVKAVVKAVHLQ